MKIKSRAFWLPLLMAAFAFNTACAAPMLIANFDDLPEGYFTDEITNGGIRLFNLTQFPSRSVFTIEGTVASAMGPLFSAPNYLGFGGYSPGPGSALTRFGSARIDFVGQASEASLVTFYPIFDLSIGKSLNLTAYLGTVSVGSASIIFGEGSPIITNSQGAYRLSFAGAIFDNLRLTVTNSNGQPDYVLIGIDDIKIVLVPEPSTTFLGLALLAITSTLRRKSVPHNRE